MCYQILAIAILGGAIILGICLVSCSSPPVPQFPAPKPAPMVEPSAIDTRKGVQAIETHLQPATQKARDLTPANLPVEKPTLVQWLESAYAETEHAIMLAKATEMTAKAADKASAQLVKDIAARDVALAIAAKQNEKLKKELKDYHESLVLWTFVGLMGLCGVACLGGLYLLFRMDFLNGGAVLGMGIAGIALFNFFIRAQAMVMWIAGGVLLLGLGAFAYLAYRKVHEDAASGIRGTQALIAAGILPMDEARPVLNGVQTKGYKAMVNRNTPKKPKPSPEPTHRANIASPMNAFASGFVLGGA